MYDFSPVYVCACVCALGKQECTGMLTCLQFSKLTLAHTPSPPSHTQPRTNPAIHTVSHTHTAILLPALLALSHTNKRALPTPHITHSLTQTLPYTVSHTQHYPYPHC